MVDQKQVLLQNVDQNQYGSNDLIVNAVTGTILQVGDRYPSWLDEHGNVFGGSPDIPGGRL